jgi:nucleoside-diphosphate-sugar epimerase
MERHSVLVTGGNGYLGSVLVEDLKRRGYRVVVFDNCLTSQTFPPGLSYHNVSYLHGDIREASGL